MALTPRRREEHRVRVHSDSMELERQVLHTGPEENRACTRKNQRLVKLTEVGSGLHGSNSGDTSRHPRRQGSANAPHARIAHTSA